jgi:hypothetical protein
MDFTQRHRAATKLAMRRLGASIVFEPVSNRCDERPDEGEQLLFVTGSRTLDGLDEVHTKPGVVADSLIEPRREANVIYTGRTEDENAYICSDCVLDTGWICRCGAASAEGSV